MGVRLTSGFLLEPEQSTSAIVVHHPGAKYFVVHSRAFPRQDAVGAGKADARTADSKKTKSRIGLLII
jgi:hypothetical protein